MLAILNSPSCNKTISFPRISQRKVTKQIESRSPVRRSIEFPCQPEPVSEPLPTSSGPVLSGIDLLTGKWTLHVLCALREGPVRLGQLHRRFPDSSKKVLTQTLRRLEQYRLLYRQDLSGKVRHVEYHLTPALQVEVDSLLDQLERWGKAYERYIEADPFQRI